MALIDTILQKGYSSYQKYHLTKMTRNINGTSQKWHLKKLASQNLTLLVFWSTTNTLLIEPTPTVTHRRVIGISLRSGKKLTLNDHEAESYNKCKNFILKITQFSHPWQITLEHFFALQNMCYFCKALFFLGSIFVYIRWRISHVPF